jgi:hypothetical protein
MKKYYIQTKINWDNFTSDPIRYAVEDIQGKIYEIFNTEEEAKSFKQNLEMKSKGNNFAGSMKDNINPSHYKQGKVECIDAIESATINKKGIIATDTGNVIKYLWRCEDKNGKEDLIKAKWYIEDMIEKWDEYYPKQK